MPRGSCSNCGRSSDSSVAREYLLHDRDSIFARTLDESIGSLGLTVLTTTALTRHRIDGRLGVRARPVLGDLHHEYMLAPALM